MTSVPASLRVLALAPIGRDAELICEHLQKAGIACQPCEDIEQVCHEMKYGVGALLFTEEALTPQAVPLLVHALKAEPAWSEVPVLILTGLPSLEAKPRTFGDLRTRTSLTMLDRPVRIQSLISAVFSALSARQRQYDVCELMTKLEERVHERDRFLAILGHELRNPLGAILLASQMTNGDGHLDKDHGRLIERQARHLTRLVNDLLELSRVVSGKIVIKPQVMDLRKVAEQSLETLVEGGRAHHLTVEHEFPDEPLLMKGDPVRIDQIISNVLTNAVKYTTNGGHIWFSVRRDGDEAVITVRDDGVGIDPQRIGSIFELFAQAENTIGRSQGGMGIGLALVRNLVELHDGTITAKSDGVGKGSTFEIRFPTAEHAQPADEECAPAAPAPRRPHKPRHIVIVEDNTDVRELLRLKLKRLGHTVDAVGDGVSGVDAILRSRPSIALIDIGLPRLDGYQVATQVRSHLGDDVVLVAVSGFGQAEDKKKAMEAGFNDHLTKPADVHDIENLLARFPAKES